MKINAFTDTGKTNPIQTQNKSNTKPIKANSNPIKPNFTNYLLQEKLMPKPLSLSIIHSILKKDRNYEPQTSN